MNENTKILLLQSYQENVAKLFFGFFSSQVFSQICLVVIDYDLK